MKTNHGYIFKYEENSNDLPEADLQFADSYYITKCLGCDTVAFFREYGDDTMVYLGEFETEKYVYPEEPVAKVPTVNYKYDIQHFKNAPDTILELYKQVVSCYELRHYLLAAVGLRMIIEGFCNDTSTSNGYILDKSGNKKINKAKKELRSKSLEGRINGMEEKKLITPVNAGILQQIRDLGNATAHELDVPKKSTIKKGLNIIEDLIRTVYEYKEIKIND
ncbi:DUF4145 domain-containing protein [Virgibacillus dokdonensis]|uniref:DUF4145 domain-containing protein n=1 Tax=Virgibacillus dokdonensis TaxID=302167 RepID=UPI0011319CD5|nr:DUF4145 domain-containing protein [Virgibacillus dokdonensis]